MKPESQLILSKLMVEFIKTNKDDIGAREAEFAIRFYEGESYEQIASTINISKARIGQLIQRTERLLENYVRQADVRELKRRRIEVEQLEKENISLKTTLKVNKLSSETPLEILNLSNRCKNILSEMNIQTVEQLCTHSVMDFMQKRGAGTKLISEIDNALNLFDLRLETI